MGNKLSLIKNIYHQMTKKRRNNGRSKHGRGHVKRVRCELTGALVPKDKAVKRFEVRNIGSDESFRRDLQDASTIDGYVAPVIFRKMYYCISAAIHSRKVRVRSREMRKNREPPRKYNLHCSSCFVTFEDMKKIRCPHCFKNSLERGFRYALRCNNCNTTREAKQFNCSRCDNMGLDLVKL